MQKEKITFDSKKLRKKWKNSRTENTAYEILSKASAAFSDNSMSEVSSITCPLFMKCVGENSFQIVLPVIAGEGNDITQRIEKETKSLLESIAASWPGRVEIEKTESERYVSYTFSIQSRKSRGRKKQETVTSAYLAELLEENSGSSVKFDVYFL